MKIMKILLTIFLCLTSVVAYAEDTYNFEVYLEDQIVKVYKNGQLFNEFPCSTGKKAGSTPSGKFKTHSKKPQDVWVEEDGTEINYYYLTKFNNNVAFHSQIEGDHPLVREGEELFIARKPSSLGCVRLTKEDAQWIYGLPLGVDVEVIEGRYGSAK